MSDKLNERGLTRVQILAALYNASRPQGMGFLHYDAKPMTELDAQRLLDENKEGYFDYLYGRVMKVCLGRPGVEVRLYDRDNGPGAAQRAVDAYAEQRMSDIAKQHVQGVLDAAKQAKEMMKQPTTVSGGQVNLGMDDVADVVAPKVEEAVKNIKK